MHGHFDAIRRLLAGAVLALSLPAPALAVTTGLPTTPGLHRVTLTELDMRLTVLIPEGYTGDEPVPLALVLHYGGTVTPFYAEPLVATLMAPAFRGTGAVLAAPDNTAGGWDNAGAEARVLALLEALRGFYPVDPGRVVVTGYSLGGIGTWYLAGRHPTLFSAAVPIAARAPSGPTRGWTVPLYVVHSRADEIFAFDETLAAVQRLESAGAEVVLRAGENLGHYEVGRFAALLEDLPAWLAARWAASR